MYILVLIVLAVQYLDFTCKSNSHRCDNVEKFTVNVCVDVFNYCYGRITYNISAQNILYIHTMHSRGKIYFYVLSSNLSGRTSKL